ncbi:MAG: hypothetical protein GDA67_02325 [Nitrospira sp. CR1.3]|nr:hypothetical protein [Nitrospira sp. CR1.3]
MTMNALLDAPIMADPSGENLDSEILDQIEEQSVVSLDALISLLPQYSWNQIFHTVDRLARCGKIVLRRHRFDYSLFSAHYAS